MPVEHPAGPKSAAAHGNICVTHYDHVAEVLIDRPPHNFVSAQIMAALADVLAALDTDSECRAIVLASNGKNFCAGADFSGDMPEVDAIYDLVIPMFALNKPIVAAVQGAAIGAGVGLALLADFRIASATSRFSVNFNRLGFHPGFGLSYTLPCLIGAQQASLLFYTGRRIGGEEALRIGLVDQLVEPGEERAAARMLAQEIAMSAPIAVQGTRRTLRQGYAEAVRETNLHERREQQAHFATADFGEGIRAAAAREDPDFTGK